jgi:thymidylate synthase (FAD)
MNLREWSHFFNLRVIGTTGAPHPQMKESALPVLEAFAEALPEVFGYQYEEAMFE